MAYKNKTNKQNIYFLKILKISYQILKQKNSVFFRPNILIRVKNKYDDHWSYQLTSKNNWPRTSQFIIKYKIVYDSPKYNSKIEQSEVERSKIFEKKYYIFTTKRW